MISLQNRSRMIHDSIEGKELVRVGPLSRPLPTVELVRRSHLVDSALSTVRRLRICGFAGVVHDHRKNTRSLCLIRIRSG